MNARWTPRPTEEGSCVLYGQGSVDERPLRSRDRSASRKFVHTLQQRIETLEALNNGSSIISNTGSRSTHGQDAGASPDDAAAVQTDCSRYLRSSVTMTQAWASPFDATHVLTLQSVANALPAPQNRNSSEPSLPRTPPSSGSQSQTLPTSRVANANTPDAIQGRPPSFYGATCHPHVISPGGTCKSILTSDNEADDVNIDLDPNSTHLRDHLFQSFFNYQKLWVDVVNRDTFLAHQESGLDSRWYSKFLENAMLACATRLSTSQSVRSLGAMFCDKAKKQVLVAMSEPTPANLQAFMLLSEYEVTQGVACRMLSDLGLHELASTPAAPGSAHEAAEEVDLAYALLSACFAYEGVWTLYLGRPSCIPKSFVSVLSSRSREGRRSDSPWLNAWVGLCVPMAEISHTLNDQSLSDPARCDLLRKLLNNVEIWYEKLPPELTYNEDRLTSMDLAGYGLHTQFCKVQILIRRALCSSYNPRKRQYSQMIYDQSTGSSTDHSHAVVYQYALRIARLVVTYREAFGLEKMPSIVLDNAVVAATVMIEHLNKSENEHDRQSQTVWLRQLVKSMEAVQPHFPIAGHMLDSLRNICGQGIVSNIFAPARCASIDATHGLSVDIDCGPPRAQPSSMESSISTDIAWEGFDLDTALGVLSSGGFDDSILHLPLPEALTPILTQMPSSL